MATTGENIKRLRKERGLTQVGLAQALGWPAERQSHISAWERGAIEPGLDSLIELALALNCSVADIQHAVTLKREEVAA